MALAWCLVFAPALHRLTHSHGSKHAHSGAPTDQHGVGTFEHQSVTFTANATAPVVTLQLFAVFTPRELAPVPPELSALRRVEQSQAP